MQINIENVEESLFLGNFEKVYNQSRKAIRDFLEDQSERNLHDLRSSFRRLDAVIHLIPKDARNAYPSIGKYRNRCKELMQLSSPARDIDVVCTSLQKLAPEQYRSSFSKRLKSRRDKYINDVVKSSWKLFERHLPKTDLLYFNELRQHSEKVIVNLVDSISRKMSLTLESESNKDALHSLRKKCKKFRYTLELLPDATDRNSKLALMKELQDRLGSILECDVIIEYLSECKPANYITDIVQRKLAERHEKYTSFAEDFKDIEYFRHRIGSQIQD